MRPTVCVCAGGNRIVTERDRAAAALQEIAGSRNAAAVELHGAAAGAGKVQRGVVDIVGRSDVGVLQHERAAADRRSTVMVVIAADHQCAGAGLRQAGAAIDIAAERQQIARAGNRHHRIAVEGQRRGDGVRAREVDHGRAGPVVEGDHPAAGKGQTGTAGEVHLAGRLGGIEVDGRLHGAAAAEVDRHALAAGNTLREPIPRRAQSLPPAELLPTHWLVTFVTTRSI